MALVDGLWFRNKMGSVGCLCHSVVASFMNIVLHVL